MLYPLASLTREYAVAAPLLHALSMRSGVCLRPQIADNMTDYEGRFRAGEPDFAIACPRLLAVEHSRLPYVPLLKDAKARLSGVLVVRKDSGIRTLQDLRGSSIGLPSAETLPASLLIRDRLNRDGVEHELEVLGSHANVLRGVLRGRVVAGGVIQRALDNETSEIKSQLRVLLRVPDQPPPPLVAHPRVPQAVRDAVVAAVMALSREPEWRKPLAAVWLADPEPAVYDRDYQRFEGLRLYLEPGQTARTPGR